MHDISKSNTTKKIPVVNPKASQDVLVTELFVSVLSSNLHNWTAGWLVGISLF